MTENEPSARDIAAMSEEERAQWFYENREQVAEESTPAVLDRVVSVRISPEDLGLLTEAAAAAGMKLSAWMRKVAVEAAAMASATPPAAVLSGEETRQLQDSVENIVALLTRSGIRLGAHGDERDQPLVLKAGRRARKKKVRSGK